MSVKPPSHCAYCGTPWPVDQMTWPRTCSGCRETTWKNPAPVMVCLVPLREHPGHVLAVRRGIPPSMGGLALPGGYLETGETWQEGAVRELWEECGVVVGTPGVRLYDVASTPRNPNVLLIFVEVVVPVSFPSAFKPNDEVLEVVPAQGGLAFPTHEEVLQRYLETRTGYVTSAKDQKCP